MGITANIKREVRFVGGLVRLLRRIKPIQLDSDVLICDDIEEAIDKWPDNICVEDENRKLTYREFEALANRYANWAKGRNLKRGDTIALVMHNRVEYVAAWFGFSKVGIATALINNNLTGAALGHCLNISGAFNVVTDEDCWQAVEETRSRIDRDLMLWVIGLGESNESNNRRDLDNAVRSASSVRPDRSIRKGLTNRDTALYIYTSGTTGLPKAARIPHSRARTYMRAFAGGTGATSKDTLFNVLPLYHSTGGLVGVGSVLLNGGRMVTRRRFSASSFWPDVKSSGATLFVYIGELCRYLVNSPENADETSHKLRLAFGNGLRPDVWEEFQNRFKVPVILEFYGSTEGNVSLFNFGGKPGAIGRVPGYLKSQLNIRLIELDPETGEPTRLPNGMCKLVKTGEIGEAIGVIGTTVRQDFTGYADKEATQKKILTDVFKKGDRWFRTGDLMRQDHQGYVYFMDRLGDTYRWKGENVSTAEVEQHLSETPGVQEVIAYGVTVPGQEGRAGMVGLVLEGDTFDSKALADQADRELPPYARPCFVRLLKSAETTGTFKYRKVDLVDDGFDPEKVDGPLYVRGGPDGYQLITDEIRQAILNGELRL